MPIFNSLGSNYSWSDAWLAMRQLLPSRDQRPELVTKLNKLLSGSTYLFYKGRDAIEFTLAAYGIGQHDQVLTQALACYAIEEGIKRTGALPVYVDLAPHQLNPSVATLNQAVRRAPQAKAVLIQHTLGWPAPIAEISQWCQQHNLLLIEDLAQSLGASDEAGQPLGARADAIILSFGRDKVVDGVSGGAAVFKTPPTQALPKIKTALPTLTIVKDLTYPLLTWLIRNTHQLLLGQVLFQLAKKTGWLSSPVLSPTQEMSVLPKQYAPLILRQLTRLDKSLRHRRQLAERYQRQLGKSDLTTDVQLKQGAWLRFPLLVEQPDKLAKSLAIQGIYLTDRWYRRPVDCGSLKCHSVYQAGSCPQAEAVASQLLNLPTHRGINEPAATKIIMALAEAKTV